MASSANSKSVIRAAVPPSRGGVNMIPIRVACKRGGGFVRGAARRHGAKGSDRMMALTQAERATLNCEGTKIVHDRPITKIKGCTSNFDLTHLLNNLVPGGSDADMKSVPAGTYYSVSTEP